MPNTTNSIVGLIINIPLSLSPLSYFRERNNMGSCFSCSSSATFKTIRVVHLNGYVEDFYHPVTAGQVTGKPPRHFVCTQAQLASGGPNPLKPGTKLEAGHVYFLIPHSTIQSDVSPMDLASLARKLNKIAKTGPAQANNKSPSRNSVSMSVSVLSPTRCSPTRSVNRFSGQATRVLKPENSYVVAYDSQKSSEARSWKPILDTILEKSFSRRSESDLQEKHLETSK